MNRLTVIVVAISLAAGSAHSQPAAPQCGIDATGVGAIRAKVGADPRFRRDGGDARQEIWSAESIQSLWTFTTAAGRAYPAALCEQVVDREGAMQIDRRLICEATAAACAALDAEIKARDDGSGDGP